MCMFGGEIMDKPVVLVVDDEEGIRDLVEIYLKKEGLQKQLPTLRKHLKK